MPFHPKFLTGVVCALAVAGCGTKAGGGAPAAKSAEPSTAATKAATQQAGDEAPPAEKTGGFDGKRAFAQVAKQVGFGPRPSGSPAIGRLQEYIQSELTSYGCKVDNGLLCGGHACGAAADEEYCREDSGGQARDHYAGPRTTTRN